MSDVTYTIKVERINGTEFQASIDREPEDAFGKRMVAMLLLNMATHFDPGLMNPQGDKRDQLDI